VKENKPILDYQPPQPPRKRISVPAVVTYAAVLVSLLYSSFFHVAGDAPLRHVGNPPHTMKVWQDSLTVTDAAIAKAANGQNISLHLNVSDADKALNARTFATQYFSAVYEMYPQRVYVGNGEQIINNDDGLYAADQMPSIGWMKDRHVAGVFTLYPSVHAGR
jgi:hypothetical protein